MSKSRTPRHRSAREKRLDAGRRQRAARRAQAHPLKALSPPFAAYREWFSVPAAAHGLAEYPVPHGMDLDDEAKALADMLIRLAPLYADSVPMAAVYLDHQIRRGVLHLAADGVVSAIPVPDMATVLAETADFFPGEPIPEADGEDIGECLHRLHFLGALVVDDDLVIRLAELV